MIALVLLLANLAGAAPQDDLLIRQILKESGVAESFRAGMKMQAKQARKENPAIPPETWTSLDAYIASLPLEDRLVDQWRGQFSVAELKQILAFWKTPAGKKFFRSEQLLNARQGAVGALMGLDVYDFLSKRYPAQFPVDRNQRDQAVRQFKSILQAPR